MAADRRAGAVRTLVEIESPALPGLVARVAARYGIAYGDFPDLLQETRIALWEIGAGASVTTALALRVANNKAVDLVRSSSRRRARDREVALLLASGEEDAELRHLLNVRAIELPRRLRELYELRYQQGQSEREIARSLGVCRASVRWLDRCCRRYLIDPRAPNRAVSRTPAG